MVQSRKADLHAVKRILGHRQLSTTELYLSLSNQDLKDQHDAASPYARLSAALPQQQKATRRRLRLVG